MNKIWGKQLIWEASQLSNKKIIPQEQRGFMNAKDLAIARKFKELVTNKVPVRDGCSAKK